MPARSEGVQRDDGVHAPVLEHALRGGGADGLGQPLEAAAAAKAQRNVRPDGLPRGNVLHATRSTQRATCNTQSNPRGVHTRNPRRTAGACGKPQALAFALPTDHPHCAVSASHLRFGFGLGLGSQRATV